MFRLVVLALAAATFNCELTTKREQRLDSQFKPLQLLLSGYCISTNANASVSVSVSKGLIRL